MANLNKDNLENNTYTVCEFSSNFAKMNNSFSCFNLNIASLNKHHEELQSLMHDLNFCFDIINLCEIRNLHLENFSDLFPGYSFVYRPPKEKNTGGVAMYINSKLNYTILNEFVIDNPHIDTLCIKVSYNGTKELIICNIYRHHSISIKDFNDIFKAFLKRFDIIATPVVLVGDFNINLLNQQSKQINDFYEETIFNDFTQAIKSYTRVTHNTSSLIDHVYFKNINKQSIIAGTILTDLSDHFSTFLILKGNRIYNKNEQPLRRIYSKVNMKKFSDSLPTAMNKFLNDIDIFNSEESWSAFINALKSLIDKSFPSTKFSRSKQRDKDWMSSEIKKECKLKEKLYKNYLKNKTDYRLNKYQVQKRIVNNMICKAKRSYYEKYFDNDLNNKQLWNFVNKNKLKCNIIHEVIINNKKESNPISISNSFNKYFSSIGPTLAEKISTTKSFEDFLQIPNTCKFSLRQCYSSEIQEIIHSLKNTNSCGTDDLSMKLLKQNSEILSLVLSHLINISILTGHFPSIFKTAKIIPLHKKGPRNQVSNYRPIAILSNLSKVFEKFVCLRLTEYFEKNNLLYQYQFGFRKYHSTTYALMSANDLICKALGDKEMLLGLFLDLSKAFDTVDHEILCKKLLHYGIQNNEYRLIKSFLSNRKQITVTNNTYSMPLDSRMGVPQGSILAPLLFLIYINDIKFFASNDICLKLFADDTNIFIKAHCFEDLINKSNNFLISLDEWFKANKLSLNLSKSQYIVFGNQKKRDSCLFLDKIKIKRVSSTKYLGLELHEKLKWNEAITSILSRANKYKFIFNKVKPYLSKQKLLLLYNSLILPIITYGIEIYGSCPNYLISKLQSIQNYFLKLIARRNKRYETKKLHKEMDILMLKDLYRYKLCILIFDIKNNKNKSSYLKEFSLQKRNEIHSHYTRNSRLLVTEKITNNKDTVANLAKKELNLLPTFVSQFNVRNKFKSELKRHFIDKY